MLEQIDLSKKIKKKQYKKTKNLLNVRLGELQRKARTLGIPVIVVFEGWDASGKGTQINKFLKHLDPRGYKVHLIREPNEEEEMRSFLWRFWTKIPSRGRIGIFDRSWYKRVLEERIDEKVNEQEWRDSFSDIKSFEEQLYADGYIILKFFLHISKDEQKKRFKKLENNCSTAWRVTEEDWKHHQQYEIYQNYYDKMIEKTNQPYAPWNIIEAHHRRFATLKIYNTVVDVLEKRVDKLEKKDSIDDKLEDNKDRNNKKEINIKMDNIIDPKVDEVKEDSEILSLSILDQVDLSRTIKKKEYKKQRKRCQKRLRELEHELYLNRIPVIIVYEGWDAAGKGGNIRRLTKKMDPRGYEVIPVAAPTEVELNHHYLWRFWKSMPKAGHITIFDRSWYGRVLVERVEKLCSKEEWKRAYREINEMEEQLVHFGTIIIKFWIHIDKDTQYYRFKRRERIPSKRWKLDEEDWRNREKWDIYKDAVDEMLVKTSTTHAPWTIIEGNSKKYARIKAMKTVINELENRINA